LTIFLFIAGLILLIAGAEFLVRGSSKIAAFLGISPLVIGLTVVALGTSSPEIAVSISSAINNQPDIVIGNVVGSNIFNILVVLGISSLIAPVIVAQKLVRIEVPLLIAISLAVIVFSSDRFIGRLEGIILLTGAFAYTYFLIKESRNEKNEILEEYEKEFSLKKDKSSHYILNGIFIIAGLAMLVFGSNLLVDSAVTISRYFGLSELIIGLTVIAAGTSLPELATSIIASIKGENDIAAGNIIGSSIFNLLAVLGITGLISPVNISEAAVTFDIPVMTAVAVASLPILFSGYLISRWEGVLFLFYYFAYTLYLVLDASEHDSLGAYSSIMLLFIVPLTAITLFVIFIRSFRKRHNQISKQE
jgi:cation:H+ antiporter